MKRLVLLLALFMGLGAGTAAADYPEREVTIIFPYPPGSSLDVLTREIAARLSAEFGQPFVVQNMPGASGNLGSAFVARAEPDGYTLLMTTNAPLLFNKYIMDMPFDPFEDLTPVILTSTAANALVVHNSIPATTVEEFVQYARENPGEIGFASSGIGSPHHFNGEYLRIVADIDIYHVPYQGSTPAITDLVGGNVQAGFITLGNILPYADSGDVRIIGLAGEDRSPLTPGVPTIVEVLPEYRSSPNLWNGIMAPSGTPEEIIALLNAAVNEALSDPELAERINNSGSVPMGGSPEALTEMMLLQAVVADELAAQIGFGRSQ